MLVGGLAAGLWLSSGKLARAVDEPAMNSGLFYAKWPYVQPSDILPYIYATAEKGNVDSILKAMDDFGVAPSFPFPKKIKQDGQEKRQGGSREKARERKREGGRKRVLGGDGEWRNARWLSLSMIKVDFNPVQRVQTCATQTT
jgi:hypothetical protein